MLAGRRSKLKATLECLRVGPPARRQSDPAEAAAAGLEAAPATASVSETTVAVFKELVGACPQLMILQVKGIDEAQRGQLFKARCQGMTLWFACDLGLVTVCVVWVGVLTRRLPCWPLCAAVKPWCVLHPWLGRTPCCRRGLHTQVLRQKDP